MAGGDGLAQNLADNLPGLTATEWSLLITAVGSILIGAISILINRRGAVESRAQQAAAHELERRSQGYDEMKGVADARASDLRDAREEMHRMQERIDRLREENRLLRELTRAQIAVAETHDLLPPLVDDVHLDGPDD